MSIVLKINNAAAGFVAATLSGLNISAVEIDAGGTPDCATTAPDNTPTFTGLDSQKAAYNRALETARNAVTQALTIRRGIVKDHAQYRGPSMGHLRLATQALYNATTFDGFPGDIPNHENALRDTAVYDLESFDFLNVKDTVA